MPPNDGFVEHQPRRHGVLADPNSPAVSAGLEDNLESVATGEAVDNHPRRPSRTTGRSAPLGGRLDRPWPTQQIAAGQRARRRRATTGAIAWLDLYGRWKHADLSKCAALEVWTFPPTREPHLHRGRMTVCGWVAYGRPAVMKAYESAAERDVLLELDFDRDVVAVASQPFVIRLADEREHRPDLAVLLRGGRIAIIEVKADDEAQAVHAAEPGTAALGEALASLGWTYLTQVPSAVIRRRNLRWLRGARPQAKEVEPLTAPMLAAAEDGATIADLVALAHHTVSRPVLGRLLWEQHLVCDLDSVLREETVVRPSRPGDLGAPALSSAGVRVEAGP